MKLLMLRPQSLQLPAMAGLQRCQVGVVLLLGLRQLLTGGRHIGTRRRKRRLQTFNL
jgi:hypothetical protein